MVETVAVLGASGFLGSRVVEQLETHSRYKTTPFAGSTGGAATLAHQGRILSPIDMLDYQALESALRGFDYVVNCARGNNMVLEKGFDNLLAAARACRIKKLVHISSVAIYGDPPHPDSVTEDAPLTDATRGYGAVKRDQDNKLQKEARNGLGSIILCPPNIIGRYSEYVLDIIESIEQGRFRLIEDGDTAVNVIDVDALAAIIERALDSPIHDGRRLFVNHSETITWRQLCDALGPVLRRQEPIPAIDAALLQTAPPAVPDSPETQHHGALRHLISEDVRDALKTHPSWFALEEIGKRMVRAFGGRAETYMRRVANGPIHVERQTMPEPFDRALIAQQLRRIHHRSNKCLIDLDMPQIPIDFETSMARFRDWYAEHFEIESHSWQLLAHRAG